MYLTSDVIGGQKSLIDVKKPKVPLGYKNGKKNLLSGFRLLLQQVQIWYSVVIGLCALIADVFFFRNVLRHLKK